MNTLLWGEIRSILHNSSTGGAEAISDILTRWPYDLMQDSKLLHYVLKFRTEWIPSSHSPPPCLLELWMCSKALKLFELICSVPPLCFDSFESNMEFEDLKNAFNELSYEDEIEISLKPMTKAQTQRAWKSIDSRAQILPLTRPPIFQHPNKGEIEFDNVIEELFSDDEQGSFHPGISFLNFRADSRFAQFPEMSLWFLDSHMELLFRGGSGCSAPQLVSFFEMLWVFIQGDVHVPSLDCSSPYFESCWQRFVVLRKGWDSAI